MKKEKKRKKNDYCIYNIILEKYIVLINLIIKNYLIIFVRRNFE